MADQLMTKGTQTARRDWEEERSCYMHFGDLHSSRPLLNNQGFYIRLSWDEEYVADYNAELARLLSSSGVPQWVPGNRIPSKHVVRELLRESVPFEVYRPSKKKEENLIMSRESNWMSEVGCKPSVIAVDSERKLLLIGGSTPRGFRVDVIDLVFNSWMHVYEPGEVTYS